MNLMVQGTSSFAGKSFLVMALCRILAKRGYRVAPFKSQNTSLNSFVTKDGGEIARAQALQALAAGIEPMAEMNPILIKPKGNGTSQLVVNGKPYMDIDVRSYYEKFALGEGLRVVDDALRKMQSEFDMLVIEGAGSPAEINLYERDIANMRVADMADAAVVLIADIERGGVFASIYGTIELLDERHKGRIKGTVINRFRGDIEILRPGLRMLEAKIQRPVLGVIPYINDLKLPAEDSLSIGDVAGDGKVDIAVIRLPRISNFTDFDPLVCDGASVRYVDEAQQLGKPDAVILPGTKNTIEALRWIRERGFAEKIRTLAGEVPIIGICGGFQMLGKKIVDKGIEGMEGEVDGLGLLDVTTSFEEYSKVTKRVEGVALENPGVLADAAGEKVVGYEIHMGKTSSGDGVSPLFDLGGRLDGAVGRDGMVFGTYLHGAFDSPGFRRSLFKGLGRGGALHARDVWLAEIERASGIVEESVDIAAMEAWLR